MSTSSIHIGVLDIQGSVEEHVATLKRCRVSPVLIKAVKDFDGIDGLIIPGGESTTVTKIMKLYGLDRATVKRARTGLPIWGTCAGSIILVQLGLMNMEIERNGYGRQLDSFESNIDVSGLGGAGGGRRWGGGERGGGGGGENTFHAIFIRAPRIKKASLKAEILAEYDGEPVMVSEGNMLATTFHPELTSDLRIHKYFLKIVKAYADKKN